MRELTDAEETAFKLLYQAIWLKCMGRPILVSEDPIILRVRVYEPSVNRVVSQDVSGFEFKLGPPA